MNKDNVEAGKAKNDDKISAIKLSLKPRMYPMTNDNLISPPPNDSLLKISHLAILYHTLIKIMIYPR